MKNLLIKDKAKASIIHLLLSAVVISALVSLMLLFWFPAPFLGVTNFKEIAVILISIDLVLGPLLTFIVYNKAKKSLKLDLSIIVSIQVVALSYGIYMLFLTHPVYITYYNNSFNVITAKHAVPEKAKDESFNISKLSSPTLAYMQLPEGISEDTLFNEMIDGAAEIEARTEFYQPYKDNLNKILANSLDPTKIFSEKNMDDASKAFLKDNKNIDELAFLPLVNGASANGIIVLNKNTGKPVNLIKTNPWKYTKKEQ